MLRFHRTAEIYRFTRAGTVLRPAKTSLGLLAVTHKPGIVIIFLIFRLFFVFFFSVLALRPITGTPRRRNTTTYT